MVPALDRAGEVAHGVDAVVDADEPSLRQPPIDGPLSKAEGSKLPARDHPVLLLREPHHRPLNALAELWAGYPPHMGE